MISRISFIVAAFCLLLAAPRPALAADAGEFDSLVDEAQGGYRAALFYARTGNAALAGIELRQAQAVWDEILAAYSTTPPPPYAKDSRFAADLKDITARISKGADLLDEEKGKEARQELAPVRDLIYGLRDRAGRKGYSGKCTRSISRVRTYRDILRACRAMAPAHYQKAADFKRIYDGADASISSMPQAVERKDALGVINILRELRSFDRILFFKLG